MDSTRIDRGAWRRGPLPGALTRARQATVVEAPAWAAEHDHARRGGERLTGSGPATDDLMEAAVERRLGGCLCGAVRYEVRGAPDVVGLCHCADCRKATGGTALHYADWPLAAFTLTGTLATHAGRSFCPSCGGRVVHLGEDRAEINLGSLDEPPTDLVPLREGWVIRREPWMQPVPGATQFDRDVG